MAMTRASLATELGGLYADVMTLAGLDDTDTAANLGGVLNGTLRALGVPEDDLAAATVPAGREAKAVAFGGFFLLDRAVNAVVRKMDVEGGGAKAKLSQQIANLERQRARALAVAQSFGLPISDSADGTGRRQVVVAPGYAGGLCEEPRFRAEDYAIPGYDR